MTAGEYPSTTTITVAGSQAVGRERELISGVSSIEGIEDAALTPEGVRVAYVAEVISPQTIEAELKRLGFRPQKPQVSAKKRKGFLARWVDRMAQSNRTAFGGQRLDCCTLHHKKPRD